MSWHIMNNTYIYIYIYEAPMRHISYNAIMNIIHYYYHIIHVLGPGAAAADDATMCDIFGTQRPLHTHPSAEPRARTGRRVLVGWIGGDGWGRSAKQSRFPSLGWWIYKNHYQNQNQIYSLEQYMVKPLHSTFLYIVDWRFYQDTLQTEI